MDIREAELYENRLVALNRKLINKLLVDKTTGKNIIWATNAYADKGISFSDKAEVKSSKLFVGNKCIIKPRYQKTAEEQAVRTKQKAEVMTPTWLTCYMNNICDDEWFEKEDVFNKLHDDHTWNVTKEKISFPRNKTWESYVDSRRLEITCGEAPYVVSRYDTTTGESIPVSERVGFLDRKLRIVNENTSTKEEWIKWAFRAFQASYGYEYQADNLFLARINLLFTYWDYYEERWHEEPKLGDLIKVSNIISWNFWQMDGLTGLTPLGAPHEEHEQISLFDLDDDSNLIEEESRAMPCIIRDWRINKKIMFNGMKEV